MDYDLGETFEHYRQIPSLGAVLYVWQDRRQVELRERPDGSWKTTTVGVGGTASISSIDCKLDVDALYTDAGSAPQL